MNDFNDFRDSVEERLESRTIQSFGYGDRIAYRGLDCQIHVGSGRV